MPDEIKILVAAQRKEDALFFREAVKLIPDKVIFHRFRSGVMLMQYLLKTHPKNALVFFETDMPYKNGFECLTEIRANPNYDFLNLIMLTQDNQKTIKKAIKARVNYVIKKPESIEDMKDMILYFQEEKVKPIPWNVKKYVFAQG
jgi:CheY-like chemotaxis protein